MYWLARTDERHYMSNQCRAWHDALDNFSYTPITYEPDDLLHDEGQLATLLKPLTQGDELTNSDIYLSGEESQNQAIQTWLIAQGANPARIFCHPS